MSWFYNLIIFIGTIIIGILAFSDQIAEKYAWLKDLKSSLVKFVILCFGGLLILLGTNWKDNEAEEKSAKLESERKNERNLDEANHIIQLKTLDSTYKADKRFADSSYISDRHIADSNNQVLLQKGLDSSYTKSMKASNEALAKYNLVLVDSLNQVAKKINLKALPQPQLRILPVDQNRQSIYVGKENDKAYLKIRMGSVASTSFNIDLETCLVEPYVNNGRPWFRILKCERSANTTTFIAPDVIRTVGMEIESSWLSLDSTIVLVHGFYSSDKENIHKYSYYEAFQFSPKQNKVGYRIGLNEAEKAFELLKLMQGHR